MCQNKAKAIRQEFTEIGHSFWWSFDNYIQYWLLSFNFQSPEFSTKHLGFRLEPVTMRTIDHTENLPKVVSIALIYCNIIVKDWSRIEV